MSEQEYKISRKQSGDIFIFTQNGKRIKEPKLLQSLQKLYVPPAYQNVVFHTNPNADCYAIAVDAKGKRQYFYSHSWRQKSNCAKMKSMQEFGRQIKKICRRLRNMSTSNMLRDQMIALALFLIMEGNFRVGSEKGVLQYGSYGVVTLRKEHVLEKPNEIEIRFIGKKGVLNHSIIRSKTTTRLLRFLMESNENVVLFHYKNGDQNFKIHAEDINCFLKQYGHFSTKTFRTWFANLQFLQQMRNIKKKPVSFQKKVKASVAATANRFHHTPAICKKSYLLPGLDKFIEQETWDRSVTVICCEFLNQYKNDCT
jgi:DNA topoisomerase-1